MTTEGLVLGTFEREVVAMYLAAWQRSSSGGATGHPVHHPRQFLRYLGLIPAYRAYNIARVQLSRISTYGGKRLGPQNLVLTQDAKQPADYNAILVLTRALYFPSYAPEAAIAGTDPPL
jgi:hypothetical protein